MSREATYLTADLRNMFKHTIVFRQQLEEQFSDLDHQSQTAAFGMWLFLATEVLFFGALFMSVGIYHYLYPEAFEKASERLNWQIGGINTLVLLVSSFTMVLSVHYARLGKQAKLIWCLLLTAAIGAAFLGLKAYEYYSDYQENLIPGWKFDSSEWVLNEGLSPTQVPQVKLFLMFYWIMTVIHAIHLSIAIAAVLILAWLARRRLFSPEYHSPVEVVGLYWHFVDMVWIFLLPMLYLLGTHRAFW